jgi:hypothetical protein
MQVYEGEGVGFDDAPLLLVRTFGDVADNKVEADNWEVDYPSRGFKNLFCFRVGYREFLWELLLCGRGMYGEVLPQ